MYKSLSGIVDIVERAKRERAWKSPHARKGNTWGDFHARSRFARSTIPEQKWGTTRSLRAVKTLYTLSVKRKSSIIVYEGSRTGRTRLENSWISEFFFNAFKVLEILLHSFWSWKVLDFWSRNIFKPSKHFGKNPFEGNRIKSALRQWRCAGVTNEFS